MAEFSREKHRSLVLLNDGLHGHLLLCPETVDAVLDFRSHIDIPVAIIQVVFTGFTVKKKGFHY